MEATILTQMGQVPEGSMLARKVLDSSSVGTHERLMAALVLAAASATRGRPDEAVAVRQDWIDPAPRLIDYLPVALASLAQAAAMSGDLATAQRSIEQAETEFTPGLAFFSPILALARAWVSAAGGSMRMAQDQALRAADDAEVMEQFSVAAAALHDVPRLGDAPPSPRSGTAVRAWLASATSPRLLRGRSPPRAPPMPRRSPCTTARA